MAGNRRAWLLLALGVLACACRPASGPRRNLVLVVIDTLRQDHLATYGYRRDTAPVLRRLAAEGAALDGLSPTSWTQPATASILTGLHPVRHQSIRAEPLPPQADTLAERLRRHGYSTLGVSANGLVTSSFGFDQGFEELVYVPPLPEGLRLPDASHVNEAVASRLASLREPFFLYVHYVDPHAPYAPSRSWNAAPLGDHLERRGPVEMADLDPGKYAHRPDAVLRDVIDLYDGDVRQADDGVGGLLEALGKQGFRGRTLTVVTSDHGEEFQDHGRMSHGQSLYDEVLRVPLILNAPGLIPPGAQHATASVLDIVPTVLSLLDVPLEGPALDGVDLGSWLRTGRRYEDPDRLFLSHLDTADTTGLAATVGRYKLVLGRPYRKQLFDLDARPRERKNLLEDADGAARGASLAARLAGTYNALAARALPRVTAVLTEEKGAVLAALGYVGSFRPEARSLHASIRPAAPAEDGLLGWEDVTTLSTCVRPGDPASSGQLLEGWHSIELNGRWTWPTASALLAPVAQPRPTLTVAGINHEPRPVRFRVAIGGRPVLDHVAPSGSFTATAAVPAPPPASAPWVVRIERPEAFVPARLGIADDRVLGVFLTSLCVGQ